MSSERNSKWELGSADCHWIVIQATERFGKQCVRYSTIRNPSKHSGNSITFPL
jgi:hypothetical protein